MTTEQTPTLGKASEWLYDTQEVLNAYGITAASDEDDLNAAAEEIDENALDMNVRLVGTRKWLEAAHGELWAAAENAAAWARNSGV